MAYGVDVALPVVGMMLFYRATTGSALAHWRFDRPIAKRLLTDSWPLIFQGFMSYIYMKIDQVMLGAMRGDSDVGVYAVAVRLSEAFHLIPNLVLVSVFPSLVKAQSISRELYEGRFQRLYDVFVWFAIAIGLGMQLVAVPLVHVLYGAEYASAAPVLAVHIWGGVFWYAGSAGHRYLVAENFARLSLWMTVVGAGVNVALNALWIPSLGALGAAYATFVSFVFSHWLAAAFFKDSRPMAWFFLRSLSPLGLLRRWRQ
jgi:O-antigen/teichoic acid export membrane protein